MLGGSQSYNPIRTKEVTVTSAQLLALSDFPIEILPAPGVGKTYDILCITVYYKRVSISYANAAQLQLGWGLEPLGAYQELHTSSIDLTTGDSNLYKIVQDPSRYNDTIVENKAIGFHTAGVGNPTLGNGTVKIAITYKLLSIV